MNGKIMKMKTSLRWGRLYQNKGGKNKNWCTLVSGGLSAGWQVSMSSFEDKGPAVEKRKKNNGELKKGF